MGLSAGSRFLQFAWLGRVLILGALLGAACGKDSTAPGQAHVRDRWFVAQSIGFPTPRPAVNGSTVFFASGGGVAIARDLQTGETKWATSIGASAYSASKEIGGENFVVQSGVVVAAVQFHTSGLDAATGEELWRYEAPLDTIEKTSFRPGYVQQVRIAADDQSVFIPAWGASVSAVDLHTGQARWIWRVEPTLTHRSGATGVRLSGDTVFVSVWHSLNESGTQGEAWLLALDRTTGAELARVVLPTQSSGTTVNNAPAVWHNLVYVTMTSGDLFAIDRNTKQVAWHVSPQIPQNGLAAAVITGAEVFGDIVYANGSDLKLHAYRALDGVELWSSAASQFANDLFVSPKFVYGSDGATLYMFDRRTGARFAALGHPRRSASYTFSSAPTVDGAAVFITISDGAWSFVEP